MSKTPNTFSFLIHRIYFKCSLWFWFSQKGHMVLLTLTFVGHFLSLFLTYNLLIIYSFSSMSVLSCCFIITETWYLTIFTDSLDTFYTLFRQCCYDQHFILIVSYKRMKFKFWLGTPEFMSYSVTQVAHPCVHPLFTTVKRFMSLSPTGTFGLILTCRWWGWGVGGWGVGSVKWLREARPRVYHRCRLLLSVYWSVHWT